METIFRPVQINPNFALIKPQARRYHAGFTFFLSETVIGGFLGGSDRLAEREEVLVIFGGQGPKTLLGDLWIFFISTMQIPDYLSRIVRTGF